MDLYTYHTHANITEYTRSPTVGNITSNLTEITTKPRDELSHDVKIFIMVLLCVLITVGVLGNVSVILIVTRVKAMRKPVYYCLSSLAISDTLVLCILPLIPLATLNGSPGSVLGWNFCKFTGFFDRGAAVSSVLTVFMISVERYFAICHPLRAKYVLTTKRTLVTILVIWIIAVAVCVPYVQMVQYEEAKQPDNTTRHFCHFGDKQWMLVYEIIIVSVFFFLPGLILSVLYIFIVRTVLSETRPSGSIIRRSSSRTTNSSRGKSKQVVFMLTGVVVMFIICILPHNIFIVIAVFYPNISEDLGRTYLAVLWFGRIMMYINSAGNPVMYNVVSSEYRKALRKALQCRHKNKNTIKFEYENGNDIKSQSSPSPSKVL